MAKSNDYVIYLILAAVVIAFILLKYVQKLQAESRNRMISDARARAVIILQRREMRARGTAFREMTQQEKEERRMLVLTSILHRKVIHEKDSKKDEMENESSLGNVLKSVLQMPSSQQKDIEKNESDEDDRFPNKQDIVVSDGSNTKLFEKNKEEYDSKVCSICLEKYKKGDEIYYSKNPKCDHAFHTECISLWCMKNSLCPLCRNDFVYENGDEEIPTMENNNDEEHVQNH